MADIFWLVTCEHGGHELPPAYAPLFVGEEKLLASHRGWDPGALPIAQELATLLQTPFIYSTISRLLVDCNRSDTNPAVFSALTKALPRTERLAIINRYHRPYREKIAVLATKEIASARRVIHLAVHSFTPILAGRKRNADLGLLYDSRRLEEKSFCRAWQQEIARHSPELRVRRNYPYLGRADGLTSWLRSQHTSSDYLGIEVEINQLLAADPGSHRFLAGLLADTVKGMPDSGR